MSTKVFIPAACHFFSLFTMRAACLQYSEGVRKCRTFFSGRKELKNVRLLRLYDRTNTTPAIFHIILVQILNRNTVEEKLILLLSEYPHLHHVTSPDYNNSNVQNNRISRKMFLLKQNRTACVELFCVQISDSARFCKPSSLCTTCKHQQTSVDSVGDKVTQQQTAGPEK